MSGRPRFCLLALGVCCVSAIPGVAQMHHVDKPERVTRAVGVYEWTGELGKPTASRFVPVSLFIDGKFQDAGVYLARPVPFALESGDLYTVEHAGEPQGVLDLETAARVVTGNALRDDDPAGVWYGFGKFTLDKPAKAAPALHKSVHVGVIQSSSGSTTQAATTKDDGDDGRPHMTRRDGGGASTDAGSGGSASGGTGTGSGDDTDRPTLRRRDPSQDAERRRTSLGGKAGTASVTAVGPRPGEDPDRPVLGRGKVEDNEPKPLTGMPADLHQAVAVSDPAMRDPHPFARPWEDAADRAATLSAMEALAKPRVEAYLAENKLVASAAPLAVDGTAMAGGASHVNSEGIAADTEMGAGAPPKLQRGKPVEYKDAESGAGAAAGSAAKTVTPGVGRVAAKSAAARGRGHAVKPAPAAGIAPLVLQGERIAGYVLSYGGLPTFVYSAVTSVAPANAAPDLPAAAKHLTAYVTVVAQRLPSGELQVALSAVTDSQHLDRGPRLELVDAVDPDASHRASLLFQLRGSSSRQFALYRLTSARAENTFTTAVIE